MGICDKPDMREDIGDSIGKTNWQELFLLVSTLVYLIHSSLSASFILFFSTDWISTNRRDEPRIPSFQFAMGTACTSGCQQNRQPTCTSDSNQSHNAGNEERKQKKGQEKREKSKPKAPNWTDKKRATL